MMKYNPTRRNVLKLAVSSSVVTTGCLTSDQTHSSPTDTRSPTEVTEETSTENKCKLSHEVWEKGKYGGYEGEELQFSELSEQGQHVFLEALQPEGGYSITYNGSNNPPDFRYTDERAVYNIIYEGDSYILITYTGAGCVI